MPCNIWRPGTYDRIALYSTPCKGEDREVGGDDAAEKAHHDPPHPRPAPHNMQLHGLRGSNGAKRDHQVLTTPKSRTASLKWQASFSIHFPPPPIYVYTYTCTRATGLCSSIPDTPSLLVCWSVMLISLLTTMRTTSMQRISSLLTKLELDSNAYFETRNKYNTSSTRLLKPERDTTYW